MGIRKSTVSILTAIGLLMCTSATATIIEYTLAPQGGDLYQYEYTVFNDSLAAPIEEFAIYFDLNLYENLVAGPTPLDWDPLILQPDPGLPDDGLYDVLALVLGIGPDSSLGGFVVQFDWLGPGTPASQAFDIVDPFTFEVIDSGITSLRETVQVSEPATLWLALAGLLLVWRKRC